MREFDLTYGAAGDYQIKNETFSRKLSAVKKHLKLGNSRHCYFSNIPLLILTPNLN